MKVLVTGATGFIGRKVVGRLQGAGFDVCIASRRPGRLPAAVLLPGIDAPDGAFLALMRDVTHVVHCAALNNDRNASDADYQTANATLTGRLAKAAAASTGGRFIYLSSIRAVAGPGFSGTINEATPPAPQCAYGRSSKSASADDCSRLPSAAPPYDIDWPSPPVVAAPPHNLNIVRLAGRNRGL